MRAELKRLHSPDAYDLRAFTPANETHFSLLVQATVGPADETGEESFDFVLCTPAWISEQVKAAGPLVGRHHLVVTVYDYNELERVVRAFCDRCTGVSWQDVAAKVGRLGHWEFEDYRH